MELWAMGAMVVLAIGVTLIAVGWHGRRIDRHPLCARCGFDLFGGRRWETRECPECGADVSGLAIRVGHRACRLRPLYGGLTLSIPALLVIGSMTYVYVRDIDVTPHKPAWWLVYELDWDPATEAVAFNELARRFQAGALADRHIESVADHLLENQGKVAVPWNSAWSSFIEAAHASGRLSKQQWSRYAEQGFTVQVYALTATRGNPVSLSATVVQARHTPGAALVPRLELKDVRIDGEFMDLPAVPFSYVRHVGSRKGRWGRTEIHRAGIINDLVQALPPGPHEVSATVVLLICEGDEFGDVIATRRTEMRSTFRVEEDWPRVPRVPRVTEITVR